MFLFGSLSPSFYCLKSSRIITLSGYIRVFVSINNSTLSIVLQCPDRERMYLMLIKCSEVHEFYNRENWLQSRCIPKREVL